MEAMNHEYYVSPEVAKLLEQAGFDWKCRKCYNKGVLFDMEPDEIRAQTPSTFFRRCFSANSRCSTEMVKRSKEYSY